jgi:hypothetical protein
MSAGANSIYIYMSDALPKRGGKMSADAGYH